MYTHVYPFFSHTLQFCNNNKPAISSRHPIPHTVFEDFFCTTDALVHLQSLWCQKCLPPFPTQCVQKRVGNLPTRFSITMNQLFHQDTLFLIPFSKTYPALRRAWCIYILVMPEILAPISDPMHAKAAGKLTLRFAITINQLSISSRHLIPYTFFEDFFCTRDALVHLQSLWGQKCLPLFPTQCVQKRGVN